MSGAALQAALRMPREKVVIGRGAFGEVIEAFDTSSGCIVAVKHFSLKEADGRDISKDKVGALVAEISLMKKLSHQNIVKYIGAFRTEQQLNIVMEYIAAGSVANVIHRYGKLPEAVVKVYTRDMVRGLAYLHANKVAHRDIKCENLLLSSAGVVKLSDFGCSKEIVEDNSSAQTLTGTPLFMAPEVALNKGGYDPFLADMWTVGITVIQMLQGEPPMAGRFKRPVEAILHVATTSELPPAPEDVSELCKDFLSRCIVRDPAGRLPAAELLTHPFIVPEGASDEKTSPEPPGNGYIRPVAPMTPRPNSADRPGSARTGLNVPRPPSSQRVSPAVDESLRTTSRPGSGNPFGGRHVPLRPPSSELSLRPPSSELSLRPPSAELPRLVPTVPHAAQPMGPHSPRRGSLCTSPKPPHHLPSLSESFQDGDMPRPNGSQ